MQWWHLVRALLSPDSWMRYLKSERDAAAQGVRRSVQADNELFRVVGAFGRRSEPFSPERVPV
ncbi:hypothetical protein AB0F15_33170 [Amycolatopsis sp. NPDC026612]|uniref:hypothetical protein n=1 Tax=Amycolatopsis sp. NPDC026612 TaxID=3155466 RepID=UPI0033DCC10E